ncbi:hypothetical protein L6164_024907 [Bauhinia variegata]|uniref:Uncharacterized protein n=1 Tax=Bauhinia variegata TaxID=167791 RepID=A0ACB9LZ30_BAUVA|nr:hypothetical protein L6164_024907 [Bauhinia variegata]
MEKQPNLKNKIMKILPKAAAAMTVTFQNLPFSPGRDHNRTENATRWLQPPGGKGLSMIPPEARRKFKDGSIDSQEPTSPKVSCMGQIKHKKKQMKKYKKSMSLPKEVKPIPNASSIPREEKKNTSTFRKIYHGTKPGKKSDASVDHDKEGVPDNGRVQPPPMNQMKRFASGRNTFANFDWKAQPVTPEEMNHRDHYSDEEEEEEIIIPFSAPIGAGGGTSLSLQPKKEINLWKRRTMEPPRPLHLN